MAGLNYSEKIGIVIKEAREITIKYGHDMIGTEHLLFGIATYSDSKVQDYFEKEGIDVGDLKVRIETLLKQTEGEAKVSGDLAISAPAEQILKLATQESAKCHSELIEVEHLLLAMLKHANNTAYNIISQKPFNVTYDKLFTYIFDLLPADQKTEAGNSAETKQTINPKKNKTPVLDSVSRDLIKLAGEGKLDPVIGRKAELERIAEILSRKKKNNPVIIGEPGTGKTAIVEGLAMKMLIKDVPRILHGKRLVELDISSMVAGTRYRGQFEEKLKAVMDEVTKAGNIIMFIDELHTIVGAGGAGGSLDFGNIIKPALARGDFQCIGATTFNEYRENIEKDGALERRFQKIICEPPSDTETEIILLNIKESYEQHHKVTYSNEIIKKIVQYSGRYMTDKYFPDKALDVMDEVGARVRLKNMKVPPEMLVLEERMFTSEKEKKLAVKKQDFDAAEKIKKEQKEITDKLEDMRKELETKDDENIIAVAMEDLTTVVARMTGIPVDSISESENQKLLNMEVELAKAVIGQNPAIEVISTSVRRSRTGVKDPKKPTGTFLFMGPTGVGKCLAKDEKIKVKISNKLLKVLQQNSLI